MAIIRVEGLFRGERLAACSDRAQLHWPRYFLLGNYFARFPLDYQHIVETAYASFHVKPSEDEVGSHLKEYNDNFLLFIYRDPETNTLWGQWLTARENMQKYPLAADKKTPAPNEAEIERYRQAYIDKKKAKNNDSQRFSKLLQLASVCGEPPSIYSEPLSSVENHSTVFFGALGVGVGGDSEEFVGVGDGLKNGEGEKIHTAPLVRRNPSSGDDSAGADTRARARKQSSGDDARVSSSSSHVSSKQKSKQKRGRARKEKPQ